MFLLMAFSVTVSLCQEGAKNRPITQEDKNLIRSWNLSQNVVKSLGSRVENIYLQAQKEKKRQKFKKAVAHRDRFYLDLYAGKRTDIPSSALNEARTVKFGKVAFNATPLMAALLGGYVHVIEYLLKAGADVNGTNKDGLTALHVAARSGFTSAVHKLLDFKADPNRKDRAGMTPLMYAVIRNKEKSHNPIISLLMAYGADVAIKNNKGKSALDYANAKHDEETLRVLKPLRLEDQELNEAQCHFGIPV